MYPPTMEQKGVFSLTFRMNLSNQIFPYGAVEHFNCFDLILFVFVELLNNIYTLHYIVLY